MRHHVFAESTTGYYKVALLIKGTAFNKQELMKNYVDPLVARGISADQIIAFTLAYNDDGKAPVSLIKAYLEDLLQTLWELGVSHLYVADGNYFKVLAKQSKAEPHMGYILPCLYKEFHAPETFKVCLGLNHQALIYNPDLQAKLDLSLDALASDLGGTYQALGADIIHSCWYPEDLRSIAHALDSLHQYPSLTCDIETFSLRFNEAGIGTIAFAWDEHNGLAFCCDWEEEETKTEEGFFGSFVPNHAVRRLLKQFFTNYKGFLIWHNASFDVKIIIATLWMEDLLDREGLYKGLQILTRSIEDTKIIAYLATNSCAGNNLGLKALAHEFAGNWAVEEIKDIRKLPRDKLLQYNTIDVLCAWFVYKKYFPQMVADNQEELYLTLMLPSLKTLLQTELIGMPMNAEQIKAARSSLEDKEAEYLKVLWSSPTIQEYNLVLRQQAMEKANAKLKKKQHPLEAFDNVELNPNSGPQLQGLLYEYMQLPVIDTTDTGLPATGGDTLKKLIHHTQNQEYLEVLHALVGLAGVSKILSAFIPNFEAAIDKGDGRVWLHGSFNLGGTVSGRLSSSNPNLQQLPSGSDYGKLIKSCFSAPTGWIMVGADYNALEDRINTLLTKDPNKIKVFVDGYDSHCLRASKFFPEKLPGIVDTVESVNSIKKLFPEIRQLAKSPAFALQYAGTWITLHKTLGFSEEEAKKIEQGYRELYKVSEEWVDSKIQLASKQGYVDLAFGLRLRAPLLQQVVWGGPRVPGAASAEARTLGNAVSGQSYGLLNTRAANEFMQKVWASRHRYDVLPCAQIHDAQYYLVRDDVGVVEWVNRELIKSMQWQELPEIQHDLVKLGGEMDLFWPDWAHPITLPNGADQETIKKLCQEAQAELKQAA